MAIVRRPGPAFKKMSSQNTTASLQMSRPDLSEPDMTPLPIGGRPTSGVDDIGNASRAAAGVEGRPVTGFTCARCLKWFPQGTQHACMRPVDVIRNDETPAPIRGPMSADEIRLLQEAGL